MLATARHPIRIHQGPHRCFSAGGIVVTLEQLEYFRMRARIERSLAENAGQTIAGAIHKELADRYEAAIERTQHRPIISIVTTSAA